MKYDRSFGKFAGVPRGLSWPYGTAAVSAFALLITLISQIRMPLEPALAMPQSLAAVALTLLLPAACLCRTTITAHNTIEGKQP